MKRLSFWDTVSGLVWLVAGCAESPIPEDLELEQDAAFDPAGELDSGLDGAAVPPGDDDGGRDAESDRPDAGGGRRDAALDAAKPDGAADAAIKDAEAKDAVVNDASPPSDSGMPPLSCANGQTTCGNKCVDTTTDEANCGGCGKACPSGQNCTDNSCMAALSVPSGCTAKSLGGHGYAFCTGSLTWSDARAACLGAKLDLVVIGDGAENEFVRANGDSWIAANDLAAEGQWKSVVLGNGQRTDGPQLSFNNWSSGEPNNNRKCNGLQVPLIDICAGVVSYENCAMVASGGKWIDADCEESKRFVCESY